MSFTNRWNGSKIIKLTKIPSLSATSMITLVINLKNNSFLEVKRSLSARKISQVKYFLFLEYIEKYCMSKMRDDFATQINKFLEGFHQIVPQECISYFQAKELQLLISGVPEVDIQDLKRNTDYSGYNPTDQIIVWFWEVVSEYSQEDLAKLVQFITGTSKIPVEGFSHMIGMNGIQRISIHRDPCDHQLPKSHTCFNQLDLPNYPSKEMLKKKLGICLAWGS